MLLLSALHSNMGWSSVFSEMQLYISAQFRVRQSNGCHRRHLSFRGITSVPQKNLLFLPDHMAAISVSSLIGKKKIPILTFLCQQIKFKRLDIVLCVCVQTCVRAGNATRLIVYTSNTSCLLNLHCVFLTTGKLFAILSLMQQPQYICYQFLTSVLFSFRAARG